MIGTRQTSNYLNFIIPRLQRLMGDYNAHRSEMMYRGLAGDSAIDRAITLAGQVENLLSEVAWYTAQGYEPSEPLPIDIFEELKSRQLI